MEDSFTQWRNFSSRRLDGDSIVISDSDEDNVVDNSREIDKRIIIDDSNDDSNDNADVSENRTPRR